MNPVTRSDIPFASTVRGGNPVDSAGLSIVFRSTRSGPLIDCTAITYFDGSKRFYAANCDQRPFASRKRNGKRERIETFNGNYGLNRGLAAGCFALGCIAFVFGDSTVGLGLLG